jgi:hypothetical protein
VNPETGKALTLAGTNCDGENGKMGPYIELRDHDPQNIRQRFQITDDGKIFSTRCPYKKGSNGNSSPMYLSTNYTAAESCTAGGLFWLETVFSDAFHAKTQQWKVGADGSFVVNSDCSLYKVGNLALSAIKDDDVENMMGSNVYVSIVNPASGVVRIKTLKMCNIY